MEKMKNQSEEEDEDEDNVGGQSEDPADKAKEREEEREEAEQEALDYSYEPEHEQPRLEPIKSTASRRSKLQKRKELRSESLRSGPHEHPRHLFMGGSKPCCSVENRVAGKQEK